MVVARTRRLDILVTMKNLFQTFQKSIYDPAFYRDVAEAPLSDALRFYAKMTLLLAVVMTILFSIVLVPQGIRFIKEEAPALVKKYYPHGLVVTVHKGEASSNVVEPYMIPAQDSIKAVFPENTVQNILVIDTKDEFTKKKFDEYKTFALLTKKEVATQSNRGQITIQDLRGTPDFVISEEALLSWIEIVRTSIGAFVPAGIILMFVIIMMGFALYLIPVILFALVPFFIAWIKKTPLPYAGAYKMSLYAVMPGLVLKTLLNMSGVFFVPSYLTLLVFMLVITLNMREGEQPTLFTDK